MVGLQSYCVVRVLGHKTLHELIRKVPVPCTIGRSADVYYDLAGMGELLPFLGELMLS